MLFTSKIPDVEYPKDLTVWEWAFEDRNYSPLWKYPREEIAGFTNGLTKERIDFFSVKEHSTHLSTALTRKYGLRGGETVSLFTQNTVWYPVAMFAALRIGARVNGASPAYGVEEMTHALRVAQTQVLMTVPASAEVAVAAAQQVTTHKIHIVLLEGKMDGFTTLQDLIAYGRIQGPQNQTPVWRIPRGQRNKDICGFLTFSSGTTGLPKAVMLSHQNVIAQCHQLEAVAPPGKKKLLAQTPLFHISGLVRFLSWPLYGNDECIMLPHFNMELFLQCVVDFQIEDLSIVPPIVLRLVHDPVVKNYDLSCVKRIASSSAPLSPEVIQLLQTKMPWTGFRQAYGMTESCGCISTHPPEYYSYEYANTGGQLCASTVIKVINIETGDEVGPGKVGEILAKGPQIAMGYLGQPAATAETFGQDEFLRTGDVGSIDTEGFLHIVDRIKEMIKVKGSQVAPAELEDLLHGHPGVQDCAVLGVKDGYSGERPKAFIVLKEGFEPSGTLAKELIDFVKQRRVRYKWVKEIEFTGAVPRNPSGKILRRLLRDKQQEERKCIIFRDEENTKARL